MRAILIEPGSTYMAVDIADREAIKPLLAAQVVEVRPFTLTSPLLSIAMDEEFVLKRLEPSLYHPTYREAYLLRGRLVVFRLNQRGLLMDLSDADVVRAQAIIEEFSVRAAPRGPR